MIGTRWIPWKFILKRAARSYGVMDPLALLARLRRFAQPSEVHEPIELLRAGIVFHARGLVNAKAIQFNLDWIWPYWVERQFNPSDPSFIPRAFAFSHVNLTHRNWTALGLPDVPVYPIVDPRGLVTPHTDGWSLDFWVVGGDGHPLIPSKLPEIRQIWRNSPGLVLRTDSVSEGRRLTTDATVRMRQGTPCLMVRARAEAVTRSWLAVTVRPYNPEGIQFVEKIEYHEDLPGWTINSDSRVELDQAPQRLFFSNYREGDVLHKLQGAGGTPETSDMDCDVGMATSAALFELGARGSRQVCVTVPLQGEPAQGKRPKAVPSPGTWDETLEDMASLQVPDSRVRFLYEASVKTLLLLSASEVVPGPYTYRRFWYRDACFMIQALLAAGFVKRSGRLLETFRLRQKRSGHFQSQGGEWDSNGQVLWIADRFQQASGTILEGKWLESLMRGGEWIQRKRTRPDLSKRHAGLLPAGFSAEHLGPNDFYYWDDFWGLAGLEAAARLAGRSGLSKRQEKFSEYAQDLRRCLFQSLDLVCGPTTRGAIPASPYRRMDAGAVGSLVADYPLAITEPADTRIGRTVEFLLENCFQSGAFFQDMIHSGINIYLTLAMAQTLLRMGDGRYLALMSTVADLASSTGQWPEAIHPFTDGGCMGDGQHGWAAAEWVMMVRNCFVREEGEGLVIGSGVAPAWIEGPEEVSFGFTPTAHGPVRVFLEREQASLLLTVEARWEEGAPALTVRVPCHEARLHRETPETRQYELVRCA